MSAGHCYRRWDLVLCVGACCSDRIRIQGNAPGALREGTPTVEKRQAGEVKWRRGQLRHRARAHVDVPLLRRRAFMVVFYVVINKIASIYIVDSRGWRGKSWVHEAHNTPRSTHEVRSFGHASAREEVAAGDPTKMGVPVCARAN